MSYPITLVPSALELTGKTFIATGGVQGIGFSICQATS
jgi:NAD(P)-dependent dehydrogenase (short-subunit alcohol dehydrogenase family)